jgi:hypothetical protein
MPNLLLTVRREDGAVLEDALVVLRIGSHQGKPLPFAIGDIIRPFHTHHKRNVGKCMHFLRNHTRAKGKAKVTHDGITDTKPLTVVSMRRDG